MAKGKFPVVSVAILSGLALGIGGLAFALKGRDGEPSPDNMVIALSTNTVRGSAPLTVLFQATVQGGVAPYSFAWTFGDGSPDAVGETLNHDYLQPGTYKAQLTVMDSQGMTKIKSVSITVTPEDPNEPDPIEPGDVTVVIIPNKPSFQANLSNLRSDLDAEGHVLWLLSQSGNDIDSKMDDIIVPAEGSAVSTYTIPANLQSGVYNLQAIYQNKGTSLNIGEDITSFTVEPDDPCLDPCPTGQHRDQNCNCVPDTDPCNDPCPQGQSRNSNCVCVDDPIPDPSLGDATVSLTQISDTLFEATITSRVDHSLPGVKFSWSVFNNNNAQFDSGETSSSTLGARQSIKKQFSISGNLPGGSYLVGGVATTRFNNGDVAIAESNNVSFEVTVDPILKIQMDWSQFNCFTFNPSTNNAYDVICGGTVSVRNQGNVNVDPDLELIMNISAPGQNEAINLEVTQNQFIIAPGQRREVDFNLPLITIFSPAVVIAELQVRQRDTQEILGAQTKRFTLREDGTIIVG